MPSAPLSVMLLDDDLTYLASVYDLLTQAGYEIHPFSRPAQAWDVLKFLKPDVLVLDLNMPMLDGREFLPWARKEFPQMIIIVCSGMEIVDHSVFKANGVKHILKKPVSSAMLIRTIENAVFEHRPRL